MGIVDSITLPATPALAAAAMPSPLAGALHDATLEFLATDDAGEIAGKVLAAACRLLFLGGASIWVPEGDQLECRGAVGEHHELLTGVTVTALAIGSIIPGEGGIPVAAAPIDVDGRLAAVLRVTRPLAERGEFDDSEHDTLRRLAESAGVAMTGAARLAASRQQASESTRDLALITEMSREITSTLDLDRVLRTVVNLSSRALNFDRGAIALYEHGQCDIRAVAGADVADVHDPALQDLAVRAAWAAGHGEAFYLSERSDPGSDAERTFVQIFGSDLERDRAASGLYLPLRDEEGIVGILLFEAERTEFASPRQRELAGILANQATVAVRNARLYHQVPLADAIGALTARKEAFLNMAPSRRRLYIGAAVLTAAALTLVRWPMRVSGSDPLFRPLVRADVRPTLDGVIDRVFVREGMTVDRGAPIAHLRDAERRAERDASSAALDAAERSAAIAASAGDAAGERLARLRAGVLRNDVGLLNEQVASSLVRAPVQGVVLTPRLDERVGAHVDAGDLLAVVGRTDSLELEFGVDQRDITRVHPGDEVRLRVAALPQQTFIGRVTSVALLGKGTAGASASFPVRAVVANPDGLLRPGMVAYARVLTDPASLLWRVMRAPVRVIRLWWWRLWS